MNDLCLLLEPWDKRSKQTPPIFGLFSGGFVLFDADTSGEPFLLLRLKVPAAASILAPSKQLCITQLLADYIKRLPRLAADLLTNAFFGEKRVCRGGKRRLSACRRAGVCRQERADLGEGRHIQLYHIFRAGP